LCVNAQYVNELAVDIQYPNDEKLLYEYQNALDAQADATATAASTTWIANKIGRNWFLSVDGGLTILAAEGFGQIDSKKLSSAFGLNFGKWFSPVWGLRLSFGGSYGLIGYGGNGDGTWYVGQKYPDLSGQSTPTSYFTPRTAAEREFVINRFLNKDKPYKEGYLFDLSYIATDLDFLVNLKNLFCAYNPKEFFNPVIYGGIGYAHTLAEGDRTAVNSLMEKFGLQFNFRVSDYIDLYLTGETLALPEVFDRLQGGYQTMDLVFNLKVGLTYYFGYRNFIKAPLIDQKKLDDLNAEINRLRKQLK
jgi:hypothetical protein